MQAEKYIDGETGSKSLNFLFGDTGRQRDPMNIPQRYGATYPQGLRNGVKLMTSEELDFSS